MRSSKKTNEDSSKIWRVEIDIKMTWHDSLQIVLTAIASIGGAGTIFWKLSAHIGNMWAKTYLEKIKKEYQKEIENYKAQLAIIKATYIRYSNRQFELYNKLWESLCELKFSADNLWEEANEENLLDFSKRLSRTIRDVEKSYLFIEEEHYKELIKLLEEFGNYEFGKAKLIKLKNYRNEIDRNKIIKLINDNKNKKQRYNELIDIVKKDLKKQLKENYL